MCWPCWCLLMLMERQFISTKLFLFGKWLTSVWVHLLISSKIHVFWTFMVSTTSWLAAMLPLCRLIWRETRACKAKHSPLQHLQQSSTHVQKSCLRQQAVNIPRDGLMTREWPQSRVWGWNCTRGEPWWLARTWTLDHSSLLWRGQIPAFIS